MLMNNTHYTFSYTLKNMLRLLNLGKTLITTKFMFIFYYIFPYLNFLARILPQKREKPSNDEIPKLLGTPKLVDQDFVWFNA